MGSGGSENLTYFVSGRRRWKFCGFEIPKTRFLKGKPPKMSSISQNFRLRRLGVLKMWRIFVSQPPEAKNLRIWPLKMRFLKGKSPRKELNFEFFRVAGAPILAFFGHNPKFVKKGGHPTPRADLAGFGRKGGRILLIVLILFYESLKKVLDSAMKWCGLPLEETKWLNDCRE